jgi:CheY-like chemotaxis protein
MKILIVDDQRTQSLGLSQMLKQLGHIDLMTASSAEDAYKLLRINSADLGPVHCKIDLILMDIKMPEVDGFEATKRIKEMLPDLPVIAITSYSSELDKQNASNIGFAGFISKPYSRKVLIDSLNGIMF